ncbi:phosphoribosylformylglycinamidine synthase [Breznakiellaceae bacterium SP9]
METIVRRAFVEKRTGFAIEAQRLLNELQRFLGQQYPDLRAVKRLRIVQRYDTEGLSAAQFEAALVNVFSEAPVDTVYQNELPAGTVPQRQFGIEAQPGQYDQRADSAAQCIELVTGVKPLVRCARLYIFESAGVPLSDTSLSAVKNYLVNPVDSREASTDLPTTLEPALLEVPDVPIIEGFCSASAEDLLALRKQYGLAMPYEDLAFAQHYFISEDREPHLAELRVLDTYWSDHCRHSTFNTGLESITVSDGSDAAALRHALALYEAAREEVYGERAEERPRSLMDMATIGSRVLAKRGLLADVDFSDEINACTIKVTAHFTDGTQEPWLLLFKNETHNHPTEIEPFGGAATCLGGAIRDPLSGRAYVYQALRISGGGDPRAALDETLRGKLPQIKIARDAARGFSSYGNQIGLATGQIIEFYHPGFIAKRLELGAVIGAVPAAWVRREEPCAGDVVLLVGGKTGRDGIGGATGSSKAHTGLSLETGGAEVQKGNAVEERKLQRLFRKPEVTRLIKRCNDFGAGGVSVAVGELAAGLDINLDTVPKKYTGLDGTELAISESQERMAVVTAAQDAQGFIEASAAENLDAVIIAMVTAGAGAGTARLRMNWRGKTIIDLSRSFLDTNGAPRSCTALIPPGGYASKHRSRTKASAQSGAALFESAQAPHKLLDMLEQRLASLTTASRRGLCECFDGSIGAVSVLFPWGGATQGTPECGMAALLPSLDKTSSTAGVMAAGYDPELGAISPYRAAKGAVREAVAKIACMGADPFRVRLSLQEYFARPQSPESWGLPAAALLGALEAQFELGIPAIGGKDSMSGSYHDSEHGINLSVPPTLVVFAVGVCEASCIHSGALSRQAGNIIIMLKQQEQDEWPVFKANMNALKALSSRGYVHAAYPVAAGGIAPAAALMAFGNMAGIELFASSLEPFDADYYQGSVLVELEQRDFESALVQELLARPYVAWIHVGRLIREPVLRIRGAAGEAAERPLAQLKNTWEETLSSVYPHVSNTHHDTDSTVEAKLSHYIEETWYHAKKTLAAPLVVLPVFPGTNCEWDMARAFQKAGARCKLIVFRNRSPTDIQESLAELTAAIAQAQIIALSGGFSAGDEPDGSGKFIANVFRSVLIRTAVETFLETRDGLMLGICNGFQALIKLGLVPYGEYRTAQEDSPTLTFNRIGRHVSRMVRTKQLSAASPWLRSSDVGKIHLVPVSHGEGRLFIRPSEAQELFAAGQIAFCYVDEQGQPTQQEPFNPNGSSFAIEGLCSPNGSILGKMAHSERCGAGVHINIPGDKEQSIFAAGVAYFI